MRSLTAGHHHSATISQKINGDILGVEQKHIVLNNPGELPAHLIVRFDFDTIFHFCSLNAQNGRKIDIYSRPFDVNPQANEDLYGKMPGYGRILVASIVECLAKSIPPTPEQLDPKVIRNGISRGSAFPERFCMKNLARNTANQIRPPFHRSKFIQM